MNITAKWTTIAIVGYAGTASGAHYTPTGENRAAHGGVCYLQVRRTPKGVVLGREVNGNGNHEEVGKPWALSADEIEGWSAAAARER